MPRERPENGQFCELTLEVRNPSDSTASWNAGLYAGNANYSVEWALGKSGGHALPDRVPAAEHYSGTLLFDISSSATPVQLEIGVDISGEGKARIFCRRLEAELVAIDGYYRVAEELEPRLLNRPAHAWLEDTTLNIAALD